MLPNRFNLHLTFKVQRISLTEFSITWKNLCYN